ncbi:sugar phosphate isomerase/epimerase [Methanomicrobium sp. W14]|uniref:sugar phosphate isomerase/epimerase family protein n=1 Tax=Methanomicrobium sp. W14 TaxID=2817839 RepID=UPI001AE9D784|nr:sugar phosphate isomerase/epimerase family protein [Methanomicrobium sp. W14]MBP2132307.1 sugar phosphate isomerase/epimerase [Methanomicrobium sp. W14]
MSADFYFASSAKIWSSIEWVYGIKDAGYTGWEISAEGNYRLDNPGSYSRIKEVLETTGLKASVHAPFSDLNLASMNYPIYNESVRQLSECVRLASDITERVTIHPGYLSPAAKLVPDKVWSLHKDALRQIGSVAEEYGVLACLENMPDIGDFLCKDPEEIFGMVDRVEGFGVTIDVGHANTAGMLDGFLKKTGLASHMHLHGNFGEKDEHLPVGKGNIDWKKVFSTIKSNYSGICVVEGRNIGEAKESCREIRGLY